MYITRRAPLRNSCVAILLSVTICMAGFAPARGDLSAPGPYHAAWTVVNVTPPSGSSFEAVLYYPAAVPGSGGAYDGDGAPYPAVSFGHGFLTAVSFYDSTLQHLATHGYFVIATRSQGGLFPSHSQYAIDLSACLSYLESQNANPASFLHQQVDTDAFGLSGHSMGGGASILAAAADARIKALANLAAANTNPSAIAAMADVRAPARLIAGAEDTITPVQNHGQLMYDNGAAPRQLPLIQGGSHCGFLDSDNVFCDSGSISRQQQLTITRRLLTEFFNLYLKGDQSQWPVVWGTAVAADPLVSMSQIDAGIEVMPESAESSACPGGTAELAVSVQNTGPLTTSVTILVESGGWPASATPTQTPVLSPGGAASVVVQVQIPPGTTPASDTLLISARRDVDGGTRGYAHVTVSRALIPGDVDGDGVVGLGDLSVLLSSFGVLSGATYEDGDLNGDGAVDLADLSELLSSYGTTCD